MSPALSFQGGTLVLRNVDQETPVADYFQWIKARWRCEAHHYPAALEWLADLSDVGVTIRDTVPRWQRLNLHFQDDRTPHDYQLDALAAWQIYGQRGSIVLPTGAGKTYVAIHAIARVDRSTLVIAPTIDLLHQWYARLTNAFVPERNRITDSALAVGRSTEPSIKTDRFGDVVFENVDDAGEKNSHKWNEGDSNNHPFEIGVYYGGEKNIQPITVTTYHSAGDLIAAAGNQFKLIIYDEVHHLPAPNWGETALMSPALYRLGLTATYPDPEEFRHRRFDNRLHIEDLIGPIVYEKKLDDLVGKQLAEYRTERITVDLTSPERDAYEADYAIYMDYVRSRELVKTYGAGWYFELMRQAASNREARRSVLARQRITRLIANAQAKMEALGRLLAEHIGERVLIFTEQNDVVYQISRRHLIPALTHETKAAERKHILDAFSSGDYRAIVTSKVLNEGIDVPEAKIAIVLGGNAGAREYVQRLGRVLRKVGNRQAILYEIIVKDTLDEGRAQRRQPKSSQPSPQLQGTLFG